MLMELNEEPPEEDRGYIAEDQFLIAKESNNDKLRIELLRLGLCKRPSNLTSSQTTYNDEQSKQLNAVVTDAQKAQLEGYFYKKDSKSANWQKYFFKFIAKTITLRYWRTKEDSDKQKKCTNIDVSWVVNEKVEDEDALITSQLKWSLIPGRKYVCTYRLSVYCSANRVYILHAQTDEEAIRWAKMIDKVLRLVHTAQELADKTNWAEQLVPIQKKQIKLEREQYKAVVSNLQLAGLYPDRPTGKTREGYLEMQKADGSWKKYYFMLFKDSLSYFNLDDKATPRGVILLAAITEILWDTEYKQTLQKKESPLVSPSQSPPHEDMDTSDYGKPEPMQLEKSKLHFFIIHTILRTYYLRAKHEDAMKDWKSIIEQVCNENGPPSDEISKWNTNYDIFGNAQPVPGPKSLVITESGKPKSVKILTKQDNVVIGRATNADVIINDAKVSRNHFRIENQKNVIILTDLGSTTGTYVNGKKVTKVALQPGDQIVIGSTTISFQAERR